MDIGAIDDTIMMGLCKEHLREKRLFLYGVWSNRCVITLGYAFVNDNPIL